MTDGTLWILFLVAALVLAGLIWLLFFRRGTPLENALADISYDRIEALIIPSAAGLRHQLPDGQDPD